jgi:hypothetical protein
MEMALPLPQPICRAVGLHHWIMGLSQFDGKNPIKVFTKQEDAKNIWISTIEKLDSKVMCITRFNGKIKEMFESTALVG